jgi:protein TonB
MGGEILGFFPVLEGRSPAPADYQAFVNSALNAVRQWQYAAPANGPIAFDVTFGFAHSSVHVLWEGLGSPGIGPRRVKYVEPAYPPIAQSARVEGTVIVEMHVEPDGRVSTARVLRSIPLLDKAATDLVMQWEFTPTLVNGKPVPVVVTTTLEFTLMH